MRVNHNAIVAECSKFCLTVLESRKIVIKIIIFRLTYVHVCLMIFFFSVFIYFISFIDKEKLDLRQLAFNIEYVRNKQR